MFRYYLPIIPIIQLCESIAYIDSPMNIIVNHLSDGENQSCEERQTTPLFSTKLRMKVWLLEIFDLQICVIIK
ncbi:unnamed protein product [Rotaria magnacalcarata]